MTTPASAGPAEPARLTPIISSPVAARTWARAHWTRRHQMARHLQLRRVYDDASPDDGIRVLVDRVWPRGLTKDAAHLNEWIKDAAPSTALRRWYGHRPERFTEFRQRYL